MSMNLQNKSKLKKNFSRWILENQPKTRKGRENNRFLKSLENEKL